MAVMLTPRGLELTRRTLWDAHTAYIDDGDAALRTDSHHAASANVCRTARTVASVTSLARSVPSLNTCRT